MPFAANLAQAAGMTFDNMQLWWITNQLKVRLDQFWSGVLSDFPESDVTSHPVSNWLTVIASLADTFPSIMNLTQLTQAAEAVYRLCWMASYLQGTGGISNTQAVNLLSGYNSTIGHP